MIIPMKKAKIVVLKDDKDELLLNLQKCGEIMLFSTTEETHNVDIDAESAIIQRTEKTLKFIKKYRKESQKNSNYTIANNYEFFALDNKRNDLLASIEYLENSNNVLKNSNQALLDSIKVLMPWESLDIPLDKIATPKYAKIHFGFVEVRNLTSFLSLLDEYGCDRILYAKSRDSQAVQFVTYIKDDEEIMEKIRSSNYSEYVFPNTTLLVKELIDDKQSEINKNNQLLTDNELRLKEYADNYKDLALLNDQMASVAALKTAPVNESYTTIYLEGWVRSDRLKKIEKTIASVTDTYDLEFIDPLPEEQPPTVTVNNKFVSSFEVITNMFAQPDPREVDPNPVMSIWYWLIFGMMMGDVGYGVVMIIALGLMIKFTRPKGGTLKLYRVLYYSGYTTVLWGIIFGSYFGFTLYPFGFQPLISPMDDPLSMLILSIALGGCHIISGLLVKMYSNYKAKDYLAMIYDQLSWICILVGIAMMFMPSLAEIGKYIALFGAALIVLFAGRKNKNIVKRLGSGLYTLYGISSYMGDLLSYARVMALALSSAVIGMVMNMLGQMVLGNGGIGIIFGLVIFVIGHVFNLGMGLLSAYVHDSRLQYIEFFGKFYTGGGYAFDPLSIKLKYIDEIEESPVKK